MKFILDTNVCRDVKFLRELAPLSERHRHQVLISVLVVAERAAQLRRERAATFQENRIRDSFRTFQFEVVPISEDDAFKLALKLSSWYPDAAAWTRAKLEQQHRALRLSSVLEVKSSHTYPATLDWYLAAHAAWLGANAERAVAYGALPDAGPDAVLVTEDQGLEFSHVWRVDKMHALKLAEETIP